MSKRKPDNPSAFPTAVLNGSNGDYWSSMSDGMTLRDYFAAKAVCGPLSRGLGYDARADETRAEWTARKAYEYADAMLAAREK